MRRLSRFFRGVGKARQLSNRGWNPAPQHGRKLAFEPLEDRSLLSVCVWNGGSTVDNNWMTGANWQGGTAPQPGDQLQFSATTPATTNNNFPAGTSFQSIDLTGSAFTLAGNNLTLTDHITVASAAANSTISLDVALAGPLTIDVAADTALLISGSLSGGNYLDKTGEGMLRLGGANSYSGGTNIDAGTIKVESDDALVQCGNGFLLTGTTATLDLNGHNSTVGNVGLFDGLITDNHTTAPATLSGTTYVVLNGQIDVPLNGAAPMIKGTLGTVLLKSAAWTPILNGTGGADIKGGRLLLDYTDTTSPASTVFNALDSGFDQSPQFASGPLRSSNADSAYGLGWADDASSHQVTVARAAYGDVDLDGKIDFNDMGYIIGNWGSSDRWADGDCNYDGSIDFTDLGYVIGNYGADATTSPPQVVALLRLGPAETTADSVQFFVIFSKGVIGVDASDLRVVPSGISGTIASVVDESPVHAVYIVTVSNVYGSGTIGLNLIDDGTISAGTANLDHTGFTGNEFVGDTIAIQTSPAFIAPGGLGSDDVSPAGVRYADGALVLSADDLGLGLTRSYGTKSWWWQDQHIGYGWQLSDLPYVSRDGYKAVVSFGPDEAYWYTVSGDAYTPCFGALERLNHDTTDHLLKFVATDGTVYEFYDLDAEFAGQLVTIVSPSGATVETTYHLTGDDIGKVDTINYFTADQAPLSGRTPYKRLSLTYIHQTGNANNGQVGTITLAGYDSIAASLVDIRRVTYSYYVSGISESNGLTGDLRTALCESWNATGWTGGDTYYYRYYTQGSNARLMKMAFSPQEYQNARNQYPSLPSSAVSDDNLKPYCDARYNYNGSRQVAIATTEEQHLYSYSANTMAPGYNTWQEKTVETRLDGSTATVYSNYIGQAILTDLYDTKSTPTTGDDEHWFTWNRYENGRLALAAQPSAVTGYDDSSFADLVNYDSGNSTYLNDTGLFYVTTYYDVTNPDISNTWAAGVAGYVYQEAVAEGEAATHETPGVSSGPVLVAAYDYFARWDQGTATSYPTSYGAAVAANADIIYPVAHETTYTVGVGANEQDRGAVKTSYAYTWYGTTLQTQEQTTTLPIVGANQNGRGGTTEVCNKEWFDSDGNLLWSMDERKYLTHYSYDPITGLLTSVVEDVNTSDPTVPTGWDPTLNTGGRNLTTNYVYDADGRLTQTLGPAHYAVIGTTPTAIRTADWTAYLDADHETRSASGYLIVGGAAAILGPISITKTDEDGRTTQEIQATFSGLVSALGTASIPQSSYTAWTTHQYQEQHIQLVSTRIYYNIPTTDGDEGSLMGNYDVTGYGYETFAAGAYTGRQNAVVSPDGTITQYVYDARGNAAETWMGTNREGWTNADPSGEHSDSSNNMLKVAASTYDADGNLLSTTSWADDSTSYTSSYQYDWRNRQTGTLGPDGVATLYQYFDASGNTVPGIDNLGRVTGTQTYANITSFSTLPAADLRSQTRNLYDDLGRVYESRVYQIDPQSGDVIDYLPTDYWYDDGGNLVKSATGKYGDESEALTGYGLATKYAYDSLGRVVTSYTCFDGGEMDYPDCVDAALTGDTVVEQTQTWYNQGGEVVATATYQRFPGDNSSEGPLNATNGSGNSYTTAAVNWYDGIGRTIETANLGREDAAAGTETRRLFDSAGSLVTASDGVPAISEEVPLPTYANTPDSSGDSYIVAQTEYDAAGLVYRTRDNVGRINETRYDAAGRVVRTIQHYSDGTAQIGDVASDVTVDYQYDSGRLLSMTAYNANDAAVTAQTTTYQYASPINASWQTGVVYPSDPDHTSATYDRLGRTVTTTDQRNVVHTYTYDSAGRLSADTVTSLGSSGVVDDSIRRIGTMYDDLGRVQYVTSFNDTSSDNRNDAYPETVVNEIKYEYDGWGNVWTEWQEHDGEVNTVYSPYDPLSTRVDYTYREGVSYHDANAGCDVAQYVRLEEEQVEAADVLGRAVDYDFGPPDLIDDVLSRVAAVTQGGTLASYTYLGVNTMVSQNDARIGVKLTYDPNGDNSLSGLDRFGRVVDQLWSAYGSVWSDFPHANVDPDEFTYTYDRASNVTDRINAMHAAFSETYGYDELNRLTSSSRNDGFDQSWGLDGLGNFGTFNDDGTPQTRTTNAANEITDISNAAWQTPTYDSAGNVISGPQPGQPGTRVHYVYDAWNRLTAVKDDGGNTVAEYVYDGLNRRVEKLLGGEVSHYFYNQSRHILEERVMDGSQTAVINQYVWGPGYADSPIVCLHDGDGDGAMDNFSATWPSIVDYARYYTTDANHNVTSVIDATHYTRWSTDPIVNVDRYVYSAYGTATLYGEDWTPDPSAPYTDGPLYAGYFFDAETRLYQVDHRYYDPGLSTWINRDPIGYAGGNNLYAYCGDRPTVETDPSGTAWYDYLSADKNGLNAFLRRQSDAVWNWLGRGSTSAAEFEQQRLASQLQSRSFLTAGELGIDLRPRADQAREAAERDRLLSTMDAAALQQIAAARQARMQHTKLFFSAMPYYSQFYNGYNALTGQDFVGGERLSGQEKAHSAMFFLLGGITQEGASAANAVRTEGRAMMAAGRSTFARQALIRTEMTTLDLGEEWLQAGRNAGLATTDSIVYIVRDRASGQLLKVGETGKWEGRFYEYVTRAQAEGRSVEVSLFNIDSKVKLDRVAVERQMRLKLKSEGHTLPWDDTKIGRQYSTRP